MVTEHYESVSMRGKPRLGNPLPLLTRCAASHSLWVFHAKSVPQSGLNPFIRTLFFKILKLLQYPILLLFVFDGPHKPAMKRGNKVGGRFGRGDRESVQFKLLLDEMGLEYWDVSVICVDSRLFCLMAVNLGSWRGRGGACTDQFHGVD